MSARVVQTVLVKRRGPGGFTKRAATEQVRDLGHDTSDLDDSYPNYWRFRQVSPRNIVGGSYRTFQVKPGIELVYGELKDGVRANPTPSAWGALGPSKPYHCKTNLIGQHIPGVKGRQGKVVSCATPPPAAYARTSEGYRLGSDPKQLARRKGQVMLERAGKQWPVSREYAARQLRERALGPSAFVRGEHRNEIEGRIRDLEAEPDHIPVPVGHEYRHRRGSNICAPDHPMWSSDEWNDILEQARERASDRADRMGIPLESGSMEFRPNPATTYEEILVDEVRRDPRSTKYMTAETKCIEWFRARNARRRQKGHTSPQFLAAERRRLAQAEGIDTTSNEYLDTLSPQSRRKTLRKSKPKATRAKKSRRKR